MRFRRHTRSPQSAGASESPRPPAPSPTETASGIAGPDPRRRWRRVLRDTAIVALVFAVGYFAVATWMSPAPILGAEAQAVPHVIGLPEAQALTALEGAGFRPRVSGTRPHPSKAGTVLWQDPPSAVIFSPNRVVTLALSSGPAAISIPDVVGFDTATARAVLTAAGAAVGSISTILTNDEGGVVLATRPGVGTARSRGAEVGLVVSRARPTPQVPAP